MFSLTKFPFCLGFWVSWCFNKKFRPLGRIQSRPHEEGEHRERTPVTFLATYIYIFQNKIRDICELYIKSILKSDPHLKNYLISINESPLKLMVNVFYFILTSFVFKISKFLSWLDHIEKTAWLKDKIIFKIYNVTAWLTIVRRILPKISWNKGN